MPASAAPDLRASLSDDVNSRTIVAAARRREDSAIDADDSAIDAKESFRSRPIRFDRVWVRTDTTGQTGAAAGNAAVATALSTPAPPSIFLSAKLIRIALSLYMTTCNEE